MIVSIGKTEREEVIEKLTNIQFVRKFNRKELPLGARIKLYKSGCFLERGVYNGVDLLLDNDKYDLLLDKEISVYVEYEGDKYILDKQERKYIRDLISPFRDKVMFIAKIEPPTYEKKECIEIFTRVGLKDSFTTVLPYFDKGTMYKNMELNTKYTLDDLNI